MRAALAQVYPKQTWVSDDYGSRMDFSHLGEFSNLEEIDQQQLFKLKQFVDYENTRNRHKDFSYIIVQESQKTVQVAIDEVLARHQKDKERQEKEQAQYEKEVKERKKKAEKKKLEAAKRLLQEAGELP